MMRRYWVADEDGFCAGNLRKRFALRYAEGRASLGHGTVVARFKRDGTMIVIATFFAK
jgi:hypothetical protein